MRKLIILVVAIAIIPLVEALTLFNEVSMLILMPLILIFIFLVVFVFMIIKDKIKNKSILIKKPIKEPTSTIPEQEFKIDYLKEVEELERKLPSIRVENANKQINELIKRFFSDYAGINYNFTFEELEEELKKRNKKIRCFSNNLSTINYNPEGISKENLIELIKELKDIIKSDIEESKITPEFKKEVEEKKKKINMLLKKGEKLIGKDINKARENYKKLSELYETLGNREKEAIRPSIINFYDQLGF